jgi:uncharacterized membrane protein YgdD (TMEM256/DUF423 family)
MKAKNWIRTASILAMLAVAFGAFGAHALKEHLTPQHLDTWNKAVLYQFIHCIAICITGLMMLHSSESVINNAGWLFTAGIIFFSGSLYLLSTTELHGMSVKWAGPVTPLGGMCFIAGWIMLAFNNVRSKKENN